MIRELWRKCLKKSMELGNVSWGIQVKLEIQDIKFKSSEFMSGLALTSSLNEYH
jgi:hypothetical protein